MKNAIAVWNSWRSGFLFSLPVTEAQNEPETDSVSLGQLLNEQEYASADSVFESLIH